MQVARRGFLKATAGGIAFSGVAGVASARGKGSSEGHGPPYEVWAADQGTDTVYVYRPHQRGRDEPGFREHAVLDLGAQGIDTPHMLSFSSDHRYALTANTGAKGDHPGSVAVIHTPSRCVVDVIETGPGSHFASFSPDDEYIHVDVIGESEIVRVDADLRRREFEIEDRIEIDDGIEGLTADEGAPICHDYDRQGRSLHTLGPSYHNAGLVIVDHDEFKVVAALPGDDLPTNCGTVPHPTEDKFYLTAGLPTPTDEDTGEPIEGEEGVGEYFVFDTAEDEILVDGESTQGVDAHGLWFAENDGELELWVVNRETNDGVIVDPETDAVKETIERFGPADSPDPEESDAPDIVWSSPDGSLLFGTLRGPNPLSGDPHAATGVNPGFAVWDVENRDRIETIQPDEGNEDSDFHGIAVRPVGGGSSQDR